MSAQKPVRWNQKGIACDHCAAWLRKACICMTSQDYQLLAGNWNISWVCDNCGKQNPSTILLVSVQADASTNICSTLAETVTDSDSSSTGVNSLIARTSPEAGSNQSLIVASLVSTSVHKPSRLRVRRELGRSIVSFSRGVEGVMARGSHIVSTLVTSGSVLDPIQWFAVVSSVTSGLSLHSPTPLNRDPASLCQRTPSLLPKAITQLELQSSSFALIRLFVYWQLNKGCSLCHPSHAHEIHVTSLVTASAAIYLTGSSSRSGYLTLAV